MQQLHFRVHLLHLCTFMSEAHSCINKLKPFYKNAGRQVALFITLMNNDSCNGY